MGALARIGQKTPHLDHSFKVWVVQPGLSAAHSGASAAKLESVFRSGVGNGGR